MRRAPSGEVTRDRAADGVVIAQPALGFRYGAEAFWLAGFALQALARGGVAARGASALDLGAGSGVIGALLAARGLRVRGVELREEWAALWEITRADSRFEGSLDLSLGDFRSARGPVDLVVSNPPFFARGTGPVAPDPWKAAARTESTATLADLVESAVRALGPGGVACLVVPIERADDVRAAAHACDAGVEQQVVVGARRWLGALRVGAPDQAPTRVSDRGDEVAAWYRLARGGPT